MSNQQPPGNSTLERALKALEKMEAKLAAAESAKAEPLAIVGIGCRFPGGATNPAALWRLAKNRIDCISEMTPERWTARTTLNHSVTCRAGIIDNIAQFDAQFFGISPTEANDMDPQHRLLLEVAWEALEDAGIAPVHLQNAKAGIFVGVGSHDYLNLVLQTVSQPRPYLPTGNAMAIVAGRLAYVLGLRGPCLALDTACSSSSVALHLACQSLRRGECEIALVCGSNLTLDPSLFEQLSALQILSVDGHCRTFDAHANGYVRSEGIGVLVVERLSDAQRRNDRIWAIIRGTAMSHNGRATSLTAPSVQAQSAVIRAALEDARVPPERIEYVEVHSNGSPLGDPIELEALKATVGKPRKDNSKCVLGSIKTVIGHAEAASGIASLIKAIFVLQEGVIPPNLHFKKLTSHASITDTSLVIPTTDISWKRGDQPRFAGVSSTGLSGTNVHLVLEEPPVIKGSNDKPLRPTHLFVLSAKTPDALRQKAEQMRDYFAEHPNQSLGDICRTLGAGRSHFDYRFATVGASLIDASGAITAFLRGVGGSYQSERVAAGSTRKRLGFFFPVDALHEDASIGQNDFMPPEFHQSTRRASEMAQSLFGRRIYSTADGGMADFDQLDGVDQELFKFIVQVALVETWRAWGIEPQVVLGEGTGESVAMWAAGMVELQDAMALAGARARCIDAGGRNTVDLSKVLSKIKHTAPRRTVIPSLGAKFNVTSLMTVDYWQRQIDPAMAGGNQLVLRLFPNDLGGIVRCGFPSLGPALSQRMTGGGAPIACLRHGMSPQQSLFDVMATLYVRGYEPRWEELDAPYAYRKISLPTYPFQRQKYWFTAPTAVTKEHAHSDAKSILGDVLPTRADKPEVRAWQNRVDSSSRSGLSYQKIVGIRTMTSGSIVSIGNAAFREIFGTRVFRQSISCGDLPLLSGAESSMVQVIATPDGEQKATVEIFFRDHVSAHWKRIAQSRATLVSIDSDDEEPGPPSMRTQRRQNIASARWAHRMDSLGSDPEVFLVDQLMHRQDETVARGLIAKNRACDGFINAICATTSVSHPAAYGRPWTIESVEGLIAEPQSQEGRAWLRIKWSSYELWSARVHAEFVSDNGEVLARAERIDLRAQDPITFFRAANKDPLEEAAFYTAWKEAPIVRGTAATHRKWLIVADASDIGLRLAAQLEAQGDTVVTLPAKQLENSMDPLDMTLAMTGPFWGVVYLGALDFPSNDVVWSSLEPAFQSATGVVFDLIERLSFRERVPRLWLVTRGAQAVDAATMTGLAQVVLWGLGRVLALERPDMWGGLIDLDPMLHAEEPTFLATILSSANTEDRNVLRGEKRYVARLTRLALTAQEPQPVRPDRTYVFSRALSPVGEEIARWLVARGARNLLFIDEPEVIAKQAEQCKGIQALEKDGVTISIVGGDVSDADTLQAILYLAFDQIGGVIHIEDGDGSSLQHVATRGSKKAYQHTLRKSCLVPWTLHKLTADLELDFFILISPLEASFGWEGRGANAMAAEYMDVIAHVRRQAGGRAVSLQVVFPIEAKLPDSVMMNEMVVAGIQGMPASVVVPALEQLVASDQSVAMVGWIDWESFEQAQRIRAGRPLFESVAVVRSGASGPGQLRRRIATADLPKAKRMVEEVMRKEIARLLGQAINELPSTPAELSTSGMDSMMALQLLASLGNALGTTLPVRMILNQPTFDDLIASIVNQLRSADDREPGEATSIRTAGSCLLIELVSKGAKHPFFCVAPITGSALVFQSLAQHWVSDRKFYAFNAPGLELGTFPCDKVEILASRYIEVIRQVAPRGPYLIGGYSFGAFVAYEIARILRQSGENIEACVLLDPPDTGKQAIASRLPFLAQILGLPVDEAMLKESDREAQVSSLANSVGEMLGLPPDLGESNQQLRLYRAHAYAMLDYVPGVYDGDLTVLRAAETAAAAARLGMYVDDLSYGWRDLCTHGAIVHSVPGSHLNAVTEPFVGEFARVLGAVLDKADPYGK